MRRSSRIRKSAWLFLHPGTIAEPIHCTLVRMNIEDLPPFEAVSYTWADSSGDASLCRNVLCGPSRRHLAVTSSCENVLRRLRLTKLKRLVWIDSVCIDQFNVGERHHQIRCMSRIYSSAFRVLVYLGEGSESSKALFDFFNFTSRTAKFSISYPPPSMFGHFPYDKELQIRAQVIVAIHELFQRPWFFWAWVMQEVALAKQVVAMCGNDVVPWHSLSVLNLTGNRWNLYRSPEDPDVQRHKDAAEWFPPAVRIQLGHTDKSRNLWNLVRDVRECHCSDACDKIFAILGLVNDMDTKPFIPDYSKPVVETFLGFAMYLISESKATLVDIILESQSKTHLAGLPSWIPDWSVARTSLVVSEGLMSYLPPAQHGPDTQLATFVPNRAALDLVGKAIDTIHCVDAQKTPQGCIIRPIIDKIPKQPTAFADWLGWWEKACAWWDESRVWNRISFPKLSDISPGLAFLDDVPYDHRIMQHLNELFLRISRCRPCRQPQLPGDCGPCTSCIYPLMQSFESLITTLCASRGQTLFLGQRSIFVGAGPLAMMEGDEVCLLSGMRLPWVLRPYQDGYQLVGECAFFDPGEHCDKCNPPSPRGWKRMIIY